MQINIHVVNWDWYSEIRDIKTIPISGGEHFIRPIHTTCDDDFNLNLVAKIYPPPQKKKEEENILINSHLVFFMCKAKYSLI